MSLFNLYLNNELPADLAAIEMLSRAAKELARILDATTRAATAAAKLIRILDGVRVSGEYAMRLAESGTAEFEFEAAANGHIGDLVAAHAKAVDLFFMLREGHVDPPALGLARDLAGGLWDLMISARVAQRRRSERGSA